MGKNPPRHAAALQSGSRLAEGRPTNPQETITRLLNHAAGDRPSAAAELLPIVYEELRRLAATFFSDQRSGHTLQPTALVHEAYLKLVDQTIAWSNRRQFFVVAAAAMRSILIDHARNRGRLKRGGDRERIVLADDPAAPADDALPIESIDQALRRLAELDERKARLVELRFFGGLTLDEAADVLGLARSTASEDWRIARAWLYNELRGEL
ncbi:MAG: sigma-70 family RNA polymerase sigma factor [Phycisphaerales bacterium]|nr:sigma-70 family RNA polymerase sigma factor [Phycisphaerales bacterium]